MSKLNAEMLNDAVKNDFDKKVYEIVQDAIERGQAMFRENDLDRLVPVVIKVVPSSNETKSVNNIYFFDLHMPTRFFHYMRLTTVKNGVTHDTVVHICDEIKNYIEDRSRLNLNNILFSAGARKAKDEFPNSVEVIQSAIKDTLVAIDV